MTETSAKPQTGTATCPFCFDASPADAGACLHDAAPRPAALAAQRRVVLDTNVLVSLWIFADSRYAPLRRALEDGRWQALTSPACLAEFARVLGYPQFSLDAARQQQALAEYRQLAECVVATPDAPAALPRCKDRDDQKFLELARDGQAQWLVTADRALLVLARRQRLAHLFQILTPDAALQAIAAAA